MIRLFRQSGPGGRETPRLTRFLLALTLAGAKATLATVPNNDSRLCGAFAMPHDPARHCHVSVRRPGKGHFTACFQNADGFWPPSVNCCHDAR